MEALQIHRPAAELAPADYIDRRIPCVLLGWDKRNGQMLSGAALTTFIELWHRAGHRERALEVSFTELAAFFGISEMSARRRIKDGLQTQGLARVWRGRRGPNGGVLVIIRDPGKIAARRGLCVIEPSPQRLLDFDASVNGSVNRESKVTISTEPLTDSLTEPSKLPAQARSLDCQPVEHLGTGGTGCCATAAVDALSALKASLRSALGDRIYELWLQPCRFFLAGADLRIVALTEFNRDFISQKFGAEIARVAGEVRLNFEFGQDNESVNASVNESVPGAQPNQTTKPNLTKPTNNAREGIPGSQRTEPSTDAWGGHALIAKTKAIIDQVDEGMYPWIAFSAVLAIEEGVLEQGTIDGWLADDPYQFPARLKEALTARRSSLTEIVPVKTALWRRGIKWRRAWFKSRLKLRLESEHRAQARRLPR